MSTLYTYASVISGEIDAALVYAVSHLELRVVVVHVKHVLLELVVAFFAVMPDVDTAK